MSDTSARHYVLITCIATSFLSAPAALADWSGKPKQQRYNNQFGDFPPDDIDQHIQNSLDKYSEPTEPAPAENTNQASPNQAVQTPPQSYRQSNNGWQNQNNYRNNYNRSRGNNAGFNGPWNNNRSNFSMPWGNNNGSGMNMPWGNNNGSNFSMPWGNNNSGNNNGSSFSMPWGNNDSGNYNWGNNNYRNSGNR